MKFLEKITFKILFLIGALALVSIVGCGDEGLPIDEDPLTIDTITPADGSTGISVNTTVQVKFTKAVDATTVNSSSLIVSSSDGNVTGTYAVSGSTATFTPSVALSKNTTYTIAIGSAIKDETGINLIGSKTTTFSTVAEDIKDTTAPNVASITPEANATDIALDASITIVFSEAIALSSISDASVRLNTPAYTNNIQATVTLNDKTLVIDPTVDMDQNAVYTVTLTSALTDLAGNGLSTVFTSSFTTKIVDTESPSVVSFSIANGEEGIPVNGPITVTFSEPVAESSLAEGILFRKLGETTYRPVTFSISGNDVSITPNETMLGNVQYVIDVTTLVKDLAGNRLIQAKGRVFKTVQVPIEVVSVSPAKDAVDVEIDEPIVITFSGDIDQNAFSATILNGGTYISFNTSVDKNVVTLTPATFWPEFSKSLNITIYSNTADVNGNTMSANGFSNFKTVFLSSKYWYSFKNHEVGQYLAYKSGNSKPGYEWSNQMTSTDWQVKKSSTGYTLKNAENGFYLSSFPTTVTGWQDPFYSDFVGTGEVWTFESATTDRWILRSRGNIIDGQNVTMTTDQSTSSGYRWWIITREGKIL